MDATSSADLVHTQVHPPWRTQGPSPSVRGSKGRRRKKRQLLQAPDIRPQPGHPAPEDVNNSSSLAIEALQGPDIRPGPGHPAPRDSPEIRRQPGHMAPHHRMSRSWIKPAQTSGPAPGHPASPACVQCVRAEAHVPLRPLDYIYSPSTYVLGLAKD